jgi:hypothetical protein
MPRYDGLIDRRGECAEVGNRTGGGPRGAVLIADFGAIRSVRPRVYGTALSGHPRTDQNRARRSRG